MKKVFILLVCLMALLPLQTVFGQGQGFRNDQVGSTKSGIGGSWGSWELPTYCPTGSWATGYSMRVEASQGSGDDTALNAVALYCRDKYGNFVARVSPHEGYWGQWVESRNCSSGGYITHFTMKVERSQGSGDDTAANSVQFYCSSGDYLRGQGGSWGRWGDWLGGYNNAAICGVRPKVESPVGKGDDTALNDLEFFWCSK